MGGNLYKLGRLPRAKYLEIEKELRQYLDKRFGRDLYRIPRYYGAKPDFGDVDIILSLDALGDRSWESVRHEIVTSLGIEQYGSHGNVFSTVFRDFQVDFFLSPQEEMESKSSFMDFNDLGNIIGRLFRPFNLKYGDKGLFYVYRRASGGYSREIFVSRDWERILSFVGLDYTRWVSGFHDLSEMFDWVLESPYFRSSSYLDPKSRILRTRTKQRTTIRKFIEYLEERKVDRNFMLERSRESYIQEIEASFPGTNLSEMVEKERQLEEETNEIHSKFNGKLIMQWCPTLSGKALGQFIQQFQTDFPRDQLLTMSADDIEEEVRRRLVGSLPA